MSVVINTNIPSIAASRSLYTTRADLQQAMERLSSGKRINGAKDDAAGMTVVTRMKAQISSLNQAIRNANDGMSLVATYDGATEEIEKIIIRMRELAVLAKTGTYTTADQANASIEYSQLAAEITRIGEKTKFNGTMAISSAAANEVYSFQVGFTGGEAVSISLGNLSTTTLFSAVGSITSQDNAASAIIEADKALAQLNSGRAVAGAVLNRLEHTVSNLMNVVQRTEEARSRIEDADFAAESAALARANVLTQAGSAMLAQTNQQPMYVLSLLRS